MPGRPDTAGTLAVNAFSTKSADAPRRRARRPQATTRHGGRIAEVQLSHVVARERAGEALAVALRAAHRRVDRLET